LKPFREADSRFALEVFLSYYPLKQGLKQILDGMRLTVTCLFLSYYPLKQGLKLQDFLDSHLFLPVFLSYYPLKQGLKQIDCIYVA